MMGGRCEDCVTCAVCNRVFCLADPFDVPRCEHGEMVCADCWPGGCDTCAEGWAADALLRAIFGRQS